MSNIQYPADLDYWELLAVLERRETTAKDRLTGAFDNLRHVPNDTGKQAFDRLFTVYRQCYEDRVRHGGTARTKALEVRLED